MFTILSEYAYGHLIEMGTHLHCSCYISFMLEKIIKARSFFDPSFEVCHDIAITVELEWLNKGTNDIYD